MTDPIIPVEPTEPKPWTVLVWRYGSKTHRPVADRDKAITLAQMMSESDCYIEGIFNPDGELDKKATQEAFPWRREP